jgi:hypothetical protein
VAENWFKYEFGRHKLHFNGFSEGIAHHDIDGNDCPEQKESQEDKHHNHQEISFY